MAQACWACPLYGAYLEVTLLHIGGAPERNGEDDGFKPGLMHLLHLFGAVSLFCQEGLHGCRDGVDEGDQVAMVDRRDGVDPICLVFLRILVAQADLLLIVKPCLVVGTVAGIQNPLPEAFAHGSQILSVTLPWPSVK